MRRGILILDWNDNKEPILWKYEAEDYRQMEGNVQRLYGCNTHGHLKM